MDTRIQREPCPVTLVAEAGTQHVTIMSLLLLLLLLLLPAAALVSCYVVLAVCYKLV